jgi:hypothetical protein
MRAAAPRPFLAEALETLLPGGTLVQMLRAALLDGPAAQSGFDRWTEMLGGSLENMRRPDFALPYLMPLLYDSVRRNAIELDPRLTALMRAAAVRENNRVKVVAAACRDLLSSLPDASSVLVAGDVALAFTAYARPALRHCHGLKLLVAPDHVEPLRAHLVGRRAVRELPHGVLVHRSNLHVEIESEPQSPPSISERAVAIELDGAPARALGRSDLLALVLADGLGDQRGFAQWVADAVSVLTAPGPLDWDAFTRAARVRQESLPAALVLGWLRDEFAVTIPAAVITDLSRDITRFAEDTLLDQARRVYGSVALLRCMRGERNRGLLLWRLAVPSRRLLRAQGEPRLIGPYARRLVESLSLLRQERARLRA